MQQPLIPEPFVRRVSGYEAQGYLSGRDWLAGLPRLLDALLAEWHLEPAGRTVGGSCAIAVPVNLGDDVARGRDDGVERPSRAILKVSWPHPEAAAEALALRAWDGRGAVRLLRADPERFALLIEQAERRDLMTVDIDQACGVIGDLLAQLRSPGHPRIPELAGYVGQGLDGLGVAPPGIPRRYVDQATSLAADLAASSPDILLHTDLHYENVLAARRRPWLVIDPKPLRGDPAYEIAPALWNRSDDLAAGSGARGSLRRRVRIICERAGIDEDRARAWTIVREVLNAADAGAADRQRVSLAVTIIKAMND